MTHSIPQYYGPPMSAERNSDLEEEARSEGADVGRREEGRGERGQVTEKEDELCQLDGGVCKEVAQACLP